MVEWSILGLTLLVFVGLLGYYVRVVQGHGERAMVLSTLGGLRTALVVDHLARQVAAGAPVATEPHNTPNPFSLLQLVPPNYRGEMSVPEALAAPPGSWIFDPQCRCVGYVPSSSQWLESPPDAGALWFKVTGGSGPAQLTAMGTYVWQGLPVR
jgi:hypothetical protein